MRNKTKDYTELPAIQIGITKDVIERLLQSFDKHIDSDGLRCVDKDGLTWIVCRYTTEGNKINTTSDKIKILHGPTINFKE